MPIYEYECSECHHKFDLMQKINDVPATQCPHCYKPTAVRLVSSSSFQLVGSGWYATDYKAKENKTAPKEKPAAKDKTE